MKDLKVIYERGKPRGIRDKDGYLLFFPKIAYYSDQKERYKAELEAQIALADFLLKALSKLV